MLKRRNVLNVGVQSVGNVVVRFLGMVYKLWLAKMLSPVSLGLFQLSMSLYSVFITPIASGLPNAVSRLSAREEKNGKDGEVLFSAISLTRVVALVLGILLIVFCKPLAKIFLHSKSAYPICLALVPAIVLGGSATVREGYLHAKGKSFLNAIITMCEQVIKVGAGMVIITAFVRGDEVFDATLVIWATSVGALFSFLFLFFATRGKKRGKDFKKEIFLNAYPPTASRLATSLLHLGTTTILPISLMMFGLSRDTALAEYGILTAMAYPVVYIPITVTGAMSVVLLPEVARTQENKKVKKKVLTYAVWAMIISAAFCVMLLLFAPFVAREFYKMPTAAEYMIALLPSVLCLGPAQMFSSALTGMGKVKNVFYLSVADGAIGLVLTFFLASSFGIFGFIAANCIQDILALLFNSITFFYFVKKEQQKC